MPRKVSTPSAPPTPTMNPPFVNTTATRKEKATQLDFLATLGGDTSSFLALPGGPIRFLAWRSALSVIVVPVARSFPRPTAR